MEAVAVAQTILKEEQSTKGSPIYWGETKHSGKISGERIGTIFFGDYNGGKVGVREPNLVSVCEELYNGNLCLPPLKAEKIQLAQLGSLGEPGLYSMSINIQGPFKIAEVASAHAVPYPSLWNHNAEREKRFVVAPDGQGLPRADADEKKVRDIWDKASSRLHFNRDFRLNSQPLGACLTRRSAIGGRAWPSFRCTKPSWDIPLALWTNTTLGLMLFWWVGTRQQLGRSILTISKLPELTVLDASKLTSAQLKMSEDIFNEFENEIFKKSKHGGLLPANESYRDEVRKQLDKAVLVDLLGFSEDILGPLNELRMQWCDEPTVHGGKSTRPKEDNGDKF